MWPKHLSGSCGSQKTLLPVEVRSCWENPEPVPMAMWVGGDFVQYERDFKINHDKSEHSVIYYSGIHDIIRYNVGDWLNQFDDAQRTMVRFSKNGTMSSYEVDRFTRSFCLLSSVKMNRNPFSTTEYVSQQGLQGIQKIEICPPKLFQVKAQRQSRTRSAKSNTSSQFVDASWWFRL